MASPPVTIRTKKLKRFLFVGPTGAGKSKIVNCCYNRKIDPESLSKPADVGEVDRLIGKTSSISNYVDQHERKVFVDTVGYGDARFTTDIQSFLLFFRELICYASVGYNWLFLVLRFERLTQDILIYVEMLEQLLGVNTLARCTIVFTHCRKKDIDRVKCIEANRDFPRIVHMLEKVHSIIFGDMDTFDENDSDEETRDLINQHQAKRRQRFMEQLLAQVDTTDDNVLTLNEPWFRSYWTSFTQCIGYCAEKMFGKSNELSKRYRLTIALKKEIPVTIYYESCSICLELIIEIWNTEPKVCITQCGHIFHYVCLKDWFTQKKQCPNCRADLRNLPERILGQRIGLHPVDDVSKPNSVVSYVAPSVAAPVVSPETSPEVPTETPSEASSVTSSTSSLRSPTPLGGEAVELMSSEESNTN